MRWISPLLFLFIFLFIFEVTVYDSSLQQRLVEKYSHRENRASEHAEVLAFIIDGTQQPSLMSAQEWSHMQDVRSLHQGFRAMVILLAIVTLILVYVYKEKLSVILVNLWIPFVIFFAVILLSVLFPDQLFLLFHKVFFPQGNFAFPANSFLITLYPAQFFYEFFYAILLRTVILTCVLIGVGYLSLRRK